MLTNATQIMGLMKSILTPRKESTTESSPQNTAPTAMLNTPLNTPLADQFTISPSGQRALDFLNAESGTGNEKDPELDLLGIENLKSRGEMLAQMLQMKMQSFQGDFMKQLKAAGIDSKTPIDLQAGPDGNLQVVGQHPEKETIEQFLNGNEELMKKFQELSNLADLNRALRTGSSGEKSGNPFAALYAKNSQELASSGDPSTKFQLRVAETGASFSFV